MSVACNSKSCRPRLLLPSLRHSAYCFVVARRIEDKAVHQPEIDRGSCLVEMVALVTLGSDAAGASVAVGWEERLLLTALDSAAHLCILLACAARADVDHMRPPEAARNPSWGKAESDQRPKVER